MKDFDINLPAGEEAFVLQSSYFPLNTIIDIQRVYKRAFKKDLPASTIQAVQAKYKEDIELQRELYIKFPLKYLPMCNAATRIMVLTEAVQAAREPKVIRSFKISDDEWETEEDIDKQTIIAATKAIKEEIHGIKKLQIEKARALGKGMPDLDSENFPDIDTGMDEVHGGE